jgi:hypothetical protein
VNSGLGRIRRPSVQQLLVIGEIATAMVLLTVAGLVLRSLERQTRVHLGFDPRAVTVGRVTLPPSRYSVDQRVDFVERLEANLRRIPGVTSVAIGSDLPLMGVDAASGNLLPDTAPGPSDTGLRYYRHFVTPDFFTTLGIPFSPDDPSRGRIGGTRRSSPSSTKPPPAGSGDKATVSAAGSGSGATGRPSRWLAWPRRLASAISRPI